MPTLAEFWDDVRRHHLFLCVVVDTEHGSDMDPVLSIGVTSKVSYSEEGLCSDHANEVIISYIVLK
jgi:hypothetical protein